MLRSSCLARMSPKHTLFTFRTNVHTVRLSFLATRYNFQAHTSWLSKKPSCTKILLTVRMQPAAIALNYSIENIRNDVCQKIIPIRLTSVGRAWKLAFILTLYMCIISLKRSNMLNTHSNDFICRYIWSHARGKIASWVAVRSQWCSQWRECCWCTKVSFLGTGVSAPCH